MGRIVEILKISIWTWVLTSVSGVVGQVTGGHQTLGALISSGLAPETVCVTL